MARAAVFLIVAVVVNGGFTIGNVSVFINNTHQHSKTDFDMNEGNSGTDNISSANNANTTPIDLTPSQFMTFQVQGTNISESTTNFVNHDIRGNNHSDPSILKANASETCSATAMNIEHKSLVKRVANTTASTTNSTANVARPVRSSFLSSLVLDSKPNMDQGSSNATSVTNNNLVIIASDTNATMLLKSVIDSFSDIMKHNGDSSSTLKPDVRDSEMAKKPIGNSSQSGHRSIATQTTPNNTSNAKFSTLTPHTLTPHTLTPHTFKQIYSTRSPTMKPYSAWTGRIPKAPTSIPIHFDPKNGTLNNKTSLLKPQGGYNYSERINGSRVSKTNGTRSYLLQGLTINTEKKLLRNNRSSEVLERYGNHSETTAKPTSIGSLSHSMLNNSSRPKPAINETRNMETINNGSKKLEPIHNGTRVDGGIHEGQKSNGTKTSKVKPTRQPTRKLTRQPTLKPTKCDCTIRTIEYVIYGICLFLWVISVSVLVYIIIRLCDKHTM